MDNSAPNAEFSSSIPTISLLHCNIRSLNKNYDLLISFLTRQKVQYDIIALSETWLKDKEFINLPNYTFISLPRKADTRGGGVALYLSTKMSYKKLSLTETRLGEHEMLFVELENKISVGVVYRPPGPQVQTFMSKMEEVLQYFVNNSNNAIICGDFNLNTANNMNTEYQSLLLSYGFKNHIVNPTRVSTSTSSIIDHVLSNYDENCVQAGVIMEDITDHYPTFLLASGENPKLKNQQTQLLERWDYKKTSQSIKEQDFSSVCDVDVNVAYDRFSKLLLSACVKFKTNTRRATYFSIPVCPWMTESIIRAIKRKEHWRNKTREHKDNPYYQAQYRSARNLSLALMRKRKKEYYNNLIVKANGNSKEIWRIINSVTKSSQKHNTLPDSRTLHCSQEGVAEIFNDFFINLTKYPPTSMCDEHEPILPIAQPNSFVFSEISAMEVIGTARQMKSNKAMGHDAIPVKIIKDNIEILAPVLATIFNQAFFSGAYPEQLKIGRVVPIYKADDPNDLANYRPITILSCINNLFEKLIAKRVMNFLEKFSILTENQHGFRNNHSSSTAVNAVTENVNQALNSSNIVVGIFLDIRKAFDSVNHTILLQKLERYGFRGSAINFFRSYLSDRKQYVQIADGKSSLKDVKMGVPQGSVLGPILFSLYINDFAHSLKHAKAVLYADDTALMISSKSCQEAEFLANQDLRNTLRWFKANKLELNIKKTKFILFASNRKVHPGLCNLNLGQTKIEQVTTHKYLGITLDSSLHWAPHIEQLTKKLAFGCFTLVKARKHFFPQIVRLIYFTVFHSHMTYCIESWGFTYASYCKSLCTTQKRALRIMAAVPRNESSAALFAEFNILPFDRVRDYSTAVIIHKTLTTNSPYHSSTLITPKRDTRHAEHKNLNLPIVHNVYGLRLLSFAGAKIWNNIPNAIKTLPNMLPSLKRYFRFQVH